MTEALIYILKWAVTLAVLHSVYGLLMRRETFHTLNRAMLLTILAAAMLLPLCRIQTETASPITEVTASMEEFIIDNAYTTQVQPSDSAPAAPELALWPRLAAVVYVAGAAVCWLVYLRSLVALWLLIARSRRIRTVKMPHGVRVVVSSHTSVACSWMNWIILPEGLDGEKLRTVLTHEMSHVRLGHSWDMLLSEFTARTLWFLPSAWMLRKDLRNVHEYQADSRVLASGVDSDRYLNLLISTATAGTGHSPANSFNQSPLKKRLYMMCRKPSTKAAALKAVYILPLLTVAIVAFARPAIVSDIKQELATEEAAAPLLSPKALTEAVVEAALPETEAEAPAEAAVTAEPDATAIPAETDAVTTVESRLTHALDSITSSMKMRKIGMAAYVKSNKRTGRQDTFRICELYVDGKLAMRFTNNRETYATDGNRRYVLTPLYAFEISTDSRRGYTFKRYEVKRRDMARQTSSEAKAATDDGLPEISNLEIAPMTESEYRFMSNKFWIEQHPNETHLIILKLIKSNRQKVVIDGVSRYIMDMDTYDRYMCRGIKGFGKKELAGYVVGHNGDVVKFTLVFPPLDKSVKRISIHKKNGNTGNVYNLKDVTRRPAKIIR